MERLTWRPQDTRVNWIITFNERVHTIEAHNHYYAQSIVPTSVYTDILHGSRLNFALLHLSPLLCEDASIGARDFVDPVAY